MSKTNFSDRVTEYDLKPGTLQTLPTEVEDVVSWKGSFVVYPNFAQDDELLQEIAVQMLDAGTASRDRFELARVLEECGAQLHLSSNGLRVKFSAKALRKDVPQILDVLTEMLSEPAFEEEEFLKARAQVAAQLQREMEDTSAAAGSALSRAIYDSAHPNHSPEPLSLLEKLQHITPDTVRDFHAHHFGPDELVIVAVGDLEADEFHQQVQETLGGWQGAHPSETHVTESYAAEAGETIVPMADKSNVDVYMGHGLNVRRTDDDYIPLYVGNYVLGGNFSARLMAEVRDKAGLTYGIGSGLSGIEPGYDGHWSTNVTLSRESVEKGLSLTKNVIEEFVAGGVTSKELEEKKTTINGSFIVGLSSTSRIASTLLRNAERGFPIGYLDEFPDRVSELTVEKVNDVIETYLYPDKMHVAMAGELDPVAAE